MSSIISSIDYTSFYGHEFVASLNNIIKWFPLISPHLSLSASIIDNSFIPPAVENIVENFKFLHTRDVKNHSMFRISFESVLPVIYDKMSENVLF